MTELRFVFEYALIVRVQIDIDRVDHGVKAYKKQQEAKDSYNSIDGGVHKSNRFSQHTFASLQFLILGESCFFKHFQTAEHAREDSPLSEFVRS